MTDALTQKRNEFFFMKFRELLDDWKEKQKEKGERYSNEEFARRIIEAEERRGKFRGTCDYRFVSKWNTGKMFPETYIEEIAEVLGVSVEAFSPQTHDDRYKYSTPDQNDFGDILSECARDHELDILFIQMLKRHFDFGEEFPAFVPYKKVLLEDGDFRFVKMTRDQMSDSAKMDKGVYPEVFQYERKCVDDKGKEVMKTITMSRPDLAFLKDVQEEVLDYVKYLFWKRQEEQGKEADRLTELYKVKDGGLEFEVVPSEEEIQSVIKYSELFKPVK